MRFTSFDMSGIRPVKLFDFRLRTRSSPRRESVAVSIVPLKAELSTTSFDTRPRMHSLTPSHVQGSEPCFQWSLSCGSISAFKSSNALASLFCAIDGLNIIHSNTKIIAIFVLLVRMSHEAREMRIDTRIPGIG